MIEVHKKLLKANNYYLLTHLDISCEPEFISILKESKVLLTNHIDSIDSKKLNIEKVVEFLAILPKRGSRAFENFIEALMKSKQKYIADKLNLCLGVEPKYSIHATNDFTDNRNSKNDVTCTILLINNYNFNDLTMNRIGSEKDLEGLKEFFVDHLGYELFNGKIYQDLKANEMNEIVIEFSKYLVQNSIQQAVVVMMSHGKNKRISGTDEQFIDIQKIYKHLSYQTENIFKVIIFSCCRGETAALASTETKSDNSESDSMSVNELIQENRFDDYYLGSDLPKNAVALYSTQENYQSHRELSGTIFIQSMLSVFKREYKEKPLREMVVNIRSEMRRLYPAYDQWPDIKENYFANFYL